LSGRIRVLRFLCIPCHSTHSKLPDNLLPVCRWQLSDLLEIGECFAKGASAYAIAKRLGESLFSLLNLRAWLTKAGALVETLAREMGLLDQAPPPANAGAALTLAYRWPTWPELTHVFSRAFYPKRFPLLTSHTILTG
jgi:hypothetical protein